MRQIFDKSRRERRKNLKEFTPRYAEGYEPKMSLDYTKFNNKYVKVSELIAEKEATDF
jgi:hypothetical protein